MISSLIPTRRSAHEKHFLPYQIRWLRDTSRLRIVEKSRQIGMTYVDAYDSVVKATAHGRPTIVWVSSRDELTALQYIEYAKHWAQTLHKAASHYGDQLIDQQKSLTAHVLRFANGGAIYCLSSSPDALVGKTGHVKLDEFAVHQNQRLLYRFAKPCTTWRGTLSILSTHRGLGTVFNEIITDIKVRGNRMGWSHHRVTLHDAVEQGLVERINELNETQDTREDFIARLRAECLDEEQWQQEYCCQPADESAAFLSYELLNACEAPGCMPPLEEFLTSLKNGESERNPLYIGVDVARKHDLCVIDLGEKIGDVMWDRCRIELQDRPFHEIEDVLWTLLSLPNVHRCCIDATGVGMQLAERASRAFPCRVDPVHFTAAIKEELAFGLRMAFEDRTIRIDVDPKLRADLRAIRKEVTSSGNIRFAGEVDDSHCDRFWAKALRQHAAKFRKMVGAAVA